MKTKRLPATEPVSLGLSHKKCRRVKNWKSIAEIKTKINKR